jgi:hypothetical protein
MKTLLSIIAIIFASQISNIQDIAGKYEIQDKGHFSTIELKKDKSFKYEYRGSSCWLWHDKIGKWMTEENTLILTDSFEWKEETVIMNEYYFDSSDGQIEIKFISTNKKVIEHLEVEYDDVGGSEFRQKGLTDKHGIVRFNPIKAKYHPSKDKARVRFTCKEFEDEVSIDIFPKLMNNKITFQINSTPKIEMRERLEKYKIDGDKLIGFDGNSLDSGMKFKKKK